MIKVAIYGFGRMGLTHYAILNQLVDKIDVTFVDTDKKLSFFTKRNLDAKIVQDDSRLTEKYDYSLICTPPIFHVQIIENCLKRGDKSIFVEKPFGGVKDDFSKIEKNSKSIKIGYVMRFNPLIQWIKENISIEDVKKVKGSYLSNTIEKKPKGWRNGSYSGVTNEVGAHVIDLAVYLFGLNVPIIKEKEIQSVITDVDDIVTIEAIENEIEYEFHFDWVNKNYRKPVFYLNIVMNNGLEYKVDQQKIEVFNGNNLEESISTVDLAKTVPFYLRGIDFTRQMQDLVGDQSTLANVEDALITRNFIKNILA